MFSGNSPINMLVKQCRGTFLYENMTVVDCDIHIYDIHLVILVHCKEIM